MFKWTHLFNQCQIRIGADGLFVWARHPGSLYEVPVALADQLTLGM